MFTYYDSDTWDSTFIKIKHIGAVLCIVTFLINMFLYWLFKENRNFIISNLLVISFWNFIFSIATLIPFKKNNYGPLCQTQSFLLNTSQLSQYFSSAILCFCNFISLIKKSHLQKHKEIYRILFTFIKLAVSVCFSVAIMISKSFGDSGGYCWLDIQSRYKREFVEKVELDIFAIIWLLLVIHIFLITKVYVLIIKNKKGTQSLYRHLNIYSIVIFISAIPATVNRLYMIFGNEKESKFVKLIQVFFENYCGVVINVIFWFSPWIRQSFLNAFYSLRYMRNAEIFHQAHSWSRQGSILNPKEVIP